MGGGITDEPSGDGVVEFLKKGVEALIDAVLSIRLVAGAELECSNSDTTSFLFVWEDRETIKGIPKACVTDSKPGVNIMPFGMCNASGTPCIVEMDLADEWENPGPQDQHINGEKVITTFSHIFCYGRGGEIKPINSGQDGSGNPLLVTAEQLEAMGWSNVTPEMVLDLNRVLEKYNITTPEKIAMFIATASHETGANNSLIEIGVGNAYVKNGVDYCGGGYTQLTGFANYQAFADQMLKEGLVKLDANGNNPIMTGGATYVADNFAWEAAGWHWEAPGNNINRRIDNGADFYKVSQVINGGPNSTAKPNGWDDREQYHDKAKTIF